MTYRRPLPKPHVYRDAYGDLYIDGYQFHGKQRIPPMPNRIAMTERDSKQLFVLSHTGTSPALTLDLVAVDPKWTDVTTFGVNDGPYVGNWRLYLNNGTLFAEAVDPANVLSNMRVLTRKGFESTMLDITVNNNGTVIYTELTV